MDWAEIRPILVEVEFYTSLIVNIYAILLALVLAVTWILDKSRGVARTVGQRLAGSAVISAVIQLTALILAAVFVTMLNSVFKVF